MKAKQTKKREGRGSRKCPRSEREKARDEKRGKETAQALFSLTEIKRWKDRSEEECVPEGEGAQRRKGRGGRRDRRTGHLREMDLGAPRGHILFPFEAPDKSNAAECIIR